LNVPLPPKDAKSHENLLDLAEKYCTIDQIQAVLRDAKKTNPNVRISGTMKDVIKHLRDAFKWVPASVDGTYAALCDAEASGGHLVYMFRAKSEEVRIRYSDGNAVAISLFGPDWATKQKFPLYHKEPEGEAWADFRVNQLTPTSASWTGKIYAGILQWKTVSRKEQGNDLYIHRRRELHRETYIIQWHPDGVLELRVPNSDSKDNLNGSYLAITGCLSNAIDMAELPPLDLRLANKAILKQSLSTEGPLLFSLPAVQGEDDDFAKWRVSTRSKKENLADHAVRRQFIEQFLKPEVTCNHLGVQWHLTKETCGEARELLTPIGKHGLNTVLIGSQTSSKAVQYVLDEIRRLAALSEA
jgi:hypothetical protein